jgi:type VI secretion system protein ImpG
LSLNHLSLDGPAGQGALKAMLRVHAGIGHAASLKQIESLAGIECRPVLRNIRREPWRGFCRGLAIRLLVDEEWFEGGSPVLFAEVLRRFFALYTHLNTFAEVALESRQRKGVWEQWPPLAGAQAIL